MCKLWVVLVGSGFRLTFTFLVLGVFTLAGGPILRFWGVLGQFWSVLLISLDFFFVMGDEGAGVLLDLLESFEGVSLKEVLEVFLTFLFGEFNSGFDLLRVGEFMLK